MSLQVMTLKLLIIGLEDLKLKKNNSNEWGRISDIYNEIARENKFIFPSDIIKQNKKKNCN